MKNGTNGLGVAVIGYGAIAEYHAAAMRAAGARLVAVAGPSCVERDDFARRHGIPLSVARVVDAITAEAVDVVVIASPSGVHAEQAGLALEAGRHILVEIPLALSLGDAERLLVHAQNSKRQLGVCQTERFHESFAYVSERLTETKARPSVVTSRRLFLRRSNVGWTGRARTWTDNLLWHHGGHAVDSTIRLLGGSVTAVHAASSEPAENGQLLDLAITLGTADGGVGLVALSYRSVIPIEDMVIVTDQETYVIDARGVTDGAGLRPISPHALERAIEDQDAAFLAAVRGEAEFLSSASSVLPTLRVLDAIQASLRP